MHDQWRHSGNNVPKKHDAITILEEAQTGKSFRFVEYSIVTTACLNAIGLKSRVLALKTKDVETRKSGAGHVVSEVFLTNLNKWVMIDGQWDAMPVLNNIPLNAVEFQRAIAEKYQQLELRTSSGVSKRFYIDWIYQYLYYFDIMFDNRQGTDIDILKINGKRKLMLVPLNAKKPIVFQIKHKIDSCVYTHSLNDFYRSLR